MRNWCCSRIGVDSKGIAEVLSTQDLVKGAETLDPKTQPTHVIQTTDSAALKGSKPFEKDFYPAADEKPQIRSNSETPRCRISSKKAALQYVVKAFPQTPVLSGSPADTCSCHESLTRNCFMERHNMARLVVFPRHPKIFRQGQRSVEPS